MKKIFLTIVFAVLTMSTAIFAQERIAVFPFEDVENVLTRNEMTMFYRNFSNEFTNRSVGRFAVVPRQEVERLINTEVAFQISDFSAKEKTAEMQRVLNGTQILSGSIGKWGNNIMIIVSLYTYPELQQLPGGVMKSVADKNELLSKIPELVQEMQDIIAGSGTRPASRPQSGTYKVGDTGPAGGIVFFDRGFVGDGWRYLEAAPAGSEWSGIQWGAYGEAYWQDVANTATAVGLGKQNTRLIVEHLNRRGETNRAAQLCASLDINGFKDWFLPSRDELNLMYTTLKQKGLGGFADMWYWSSSQSNNYLAWIQDFYNGNQHNYLKNITGRVRAVRAF